MSSVATRISKLKVLVIGGSGFVSGAVCRQARAAGHEVWAITRSGLNSINCSVKGLHSIQADRRNAPEFVKGIEAPGVRWDLAIDCIGYVKEDAVQDVEILSKHASHIAFVSTDAVFDYRDPKYQKDESFEKFSDHPLALGKRDCEEVFLKGCDVPWSIFRPTHIFGPGSELGCLPLHLRDRALLEKIRAGAEIRLVGNGVLLQQPIFVDDLAKLILSCPGNPSAYNQIFMASGPEVIEAREYYSIVGDLIGCKVNLVEKPIRDFFSEGDRFSFTVCHRVTSMQKSMRAGLAVPATAVRDVLEKQVRWLIARNTEHQTKAFSGNQ